MSFLLPGANDAIPYCGDTTERAARFPSPNINQRVQVVNALTRWNGSAWITDALTGSVINVTDPRYGAVGNGTTDDTAAIQSALDAATAASSAVVYFPSGTYIVTSTLTIGGFTTLVGTGLFGSIIYKTHTGDLFDVNGNFIHFIDMSLHGNTSVDPAYGTTGVAVHFSHDSGGYGCTWRGGGIYNIDYMLKFATDAGHAFRCSDAFFWPYNVAPGSDPNSIWVTGDTSAAFRQFSNIILFAQVLLEGALDTLFTGCGMRGVVTDANTQIASFQGCVFANSNNPISIDGQAIILMGLRISGNVTLEPGSGGVFIGNQFTFGSLIDNSGNTNNWDIHHRVEGTSLVTKIGPHFMRHGFVGVIMPNATVKPGNAAVSTVTTGTPTNRTIIFNSPITADRAVTLNTGSDYKDGDSYHIIRTAAATGAFNVNVGSGPLKALAAGTWCIVTYDGSTWFLTAYGAL